MPVHKPKTDEMDRERRAFPVGTFQLEPRAKGGDAKKPRRIKGHAAVFNSLSEDLGGWRETILPGAFAQTLKDGDDVRALVDHDPSKILGRTRAGTLALQEDDRGLLVDIDTSDTTTGRDIVESIGRGDVSQMSFGFRTIEDQWRTIDGEEVRELVAVRLYDVSPVSYAAYVDTDVSVAKRSLETWKADGRKPSGGPPPKKGSDDPETVKRQAQLAEAKLLPTKPT